MVWWIVGLFGCPASCCLVLCACPLDVGIICVFCALFSLLNVEGVYNEHPLMRGLGGLLDCLDALHHVVCPVCVPPGRGDYLCVFLLCFPSSM